MEKRISAQVKVMGKEIASISNSLFGAHSFLLEYGKDVDVLADIKNQSEKLVLLRMRRKELIANVKIAHSAGQNNVAMTLEEKKAMAKKNAMLALRYPLRIEWPNVFCVGKTDKGAELATKANSFLRALREEIAPSTLEGIARGTVSGSWLCKTLGIQKISEADQVLSLISSTGRKLWKDDDIKSFLSLSTGKDNGVTVLKWAIKTS